ncbi:MAG: chromosome segregation protein SMC [Hyphomicrobiales bacterium]|nr:MAG: chromosome segregation protein SMC [Hyphomicrobiales bacterium]
MIFTKLRVLGFKSFVDPIELLIEPGRTGVVGPNGCGKSNLVEALRWVMGESSYKNMRASGMDDVIFSGSLNRPSRNTAEVTLFIDNSDRTAPAAFNDDDVLEVTRRIEREAGSAYKINGKDVRARDVQLLFADASTGSRSPALVRQGQIGELISAKPTSRRAILEEAAGISGLYSRRHEAELRLKAAETNLDRLEDVLTQIGTQLEGLKRQSRQASRYKNLSGEIRKAEATLLFKLWSVATTDAGQAESSLQEITLEMAEKTKIQAQCARDEAVLREAQPKLRDAEAKAGAALQTLIVARNTLEAEEQRSKIRHKELVLRIDQLGHDLQREEQLIVDYQQSLELLQGEERELSAQGGDVSDKETAKLKASLAISEAALLEKEQELAILNQKNAAMQAERAQLKRNIENAQRTLQQLRGQKETVTQERAQVEAQLKGDSRLAGLRETLEEQRKSVSQLETDVEKAETGVQKLRRADGECRKPLRAAEQSLRNLQTEASTLARILQFEGNADWSPLVDSLTVAPGLEAALGVALGDDIDAPTDGKAPTHWGELDNDALLASDAALPGGIKSFVDYIQGPKFLARRLRQIGLVDKSEGANLRQQLHAGQCLVSREGDLWRWDGFVVASEAPTAAALRLENKNRLSDIEDEAKAAERTVRSLEENWRETTQQLQNAEENEKQLRLKLRQLRQDHAKTQELLTREERAHSQYANRIAALEEAFKRIDIGIAEAVAQDGNAKELLEKLPSENIHENQQNVLKVAIAESRIEAAEIRVVVQGQERDAALRRNRITAITREKASWLRRISDTNSQLKALRARIEESRKEKAVLDEAPDTFLHSRQSLLSQIVKAEQARNASSDQRIVADGEVRSAETAAKDALSALTTTREGQVRAEERLQSSRLRLKDLAERISDNLECAPHELREKAGLSADAKLPDTQSIEVRLNRLKSERERLGGVNLRAEEEANDISVQLEDLISERDDLIEAIRRLRLGIQSLNREGRERLLAAFEVVNGHFQHLFSHLFGGGQAELHLTESDDPLEAGLEIIARPPGKKPQTMTLLSGGEQALTAMSLIFAVFLTNPAPICVLDEVDAPLDDANVERFCSLVDEMSRQTNTRFVIVTHNPITMARMNRLFGVTMAEKGVSQLVSVDLETAEEYQEAS